MSPYRRQQARIVGPVSRHPGIVWIERHRATLPNNHWVAASSDGLVALKPTIGELSQEISRKQIDPAILAIAFITTDAL
jgi:hypothetical protein